MARRVWTTTEKKWLSENYQKLGAKACAEHLGNVTVIGVREFARTHGFARRAADFRVPSDERIDDVIRQCVESGSQTPYADAAAIVGRSGDWVRDRALALGLRIKTRNARPMSRAEAEFITKHLHWPMHRIASAMTANGYPRTLWSVWYFLRSRGLAGTDTSRMSGEDAAAGLGVSYQTVKNFIGSGLLIAERRDPESATYKPISIAEEDLAAFILLNPERVNLAKIEAAQTKAWFFDLLSRFPKPPTRSDDYLRRLIESLHTFRPEFDNERIATTLNIEEKTVRQALSLAREREGQRARARAKRAEAREAA